MLSQKPDAIYQRAWRAKNSERARNHSRKWRLNHPEKSKECSADWRRRNPDKMRQLQSDWAKRNPDKKLQASYAWKKRNRVRYLVKRRAAYARSAERKREVARQWRARRSAEMRKYWALKKRRHYEQYRAGVAVQNALKGKKLMRPTVCSQCGRSCKPEGHHHKGYAREHWLDVIWLCRPCHLEVHPRP